MKIQCNENILDVRVLKKTHDRVEFIFEGKKHLVYKDELEHIKSIKTNNGLSLFFDNNEFHMQTIAKLNANDTNSVSEGSLVSPMPGKIFKIVKKQGEKVSSGETILVMEAMKMEHSIKSNKNGIVEKIFFNEGDQVDGGVALCEVNEA